MLPLSSLTSGCEFLEFSAFSADGARTREQPQLWGRRKVRLQAVPLAARTPAILQGVALSCTQNLKTTLLRRPPNHRLHNAQ